MVTKPMPVWERWLTDPKNKEKVRLLYISFVVLLNLFIIFGIIMFIILTFFQ